MSTIVSQLSTAISSPQRSSIRSSHGNNSLIDKLQLLVIRQDANGSHQKILSYFSRAEIHHGFCSDGKLRNSSPFGLHLYTSSGRDVHSNQPEN
jgi:hypothetical protein